MEIYEVRISTDTVDETYTVEANGALDAENMALDEYEAEYGDIHAAAHYKVEVA